MCLTWHQNTKETYIPSRKINSGKRVEQKRKSCFFRALSWFFEGDFKLPPTMTNMFSLDVNGNNLGLCIFSWGLGAEMMYSSHFGFWSSVSFFSPHDFTGSGGFSLLWAPLVQPFERREEKNQYIGLLKMMSTQGQYVDGLGRSRCL